MKWSLIGLGVATLLAAGCSKSTDSEPAAGVPPALSSAAYAAAAQQGKSIVGETFQLLSSNLQSAIQQGGISNALSYCSVAALPLTRTIAERHGIAVRRFTQKPRNAQARAEGVETVILKHYEESLAATNTPVPVVTNITPDKVTFFAPIVLTQPLCLKCHGEPGKDILPEHLALITKLYPRDQATGFRPGQLRGAWRVDFPLAALDQAK